jgi:hypothetical protein
MTEVEKYRQWFKREQTNGLTIARFCLGDKTQDTTLESIFGEINRAIECGERGDVYAESECPIP